MYCLYICNCFCCLYNLQCWECCIYNICHIQHGKMASSNAVGKSVEQSITWLSFRGNYWLFGYTITQCLYIRYTPIEQSVNQNLSQHFAAESSKWLETWRNKLEWPYIVIVLYSTFFMHSWFSELTNTAQWIEALESLTLNFIYTHIYTVHKHYTISKYKNHNIIIIIIYYTDKIMIH